MSDTIIIVPLVIIKTYSESREENCFYIFKIIFNQANQSCSYFYSRIKSHNEYRSVCHNQVINTNQIWCYIKKCIILLPSKKVRPICNVKTLKTRYDLLAMMKDSIVIKIWYKISWSCKLVQITKEITVVQNLSVIEDCSNIKNHLCK